MLFLAQFIGHEWGCLGGSPCQWALLLADTWAPPGSSWWCTDDTFVPPPPPPTLPHTAAHPPFRCPPPCHAMPSVPCVAQAVASAWRRVVQAASQAVWSSGPDAAPPGGTTMLPLLKGAMCAGLDLLVHTTYPPPSRGNSALLAFHASPCSQLPTLRQADACHTFPRPPPPGHAPAAHAPPRPVLPAADARPCTNAATQAGCGPVGWAQWLLRQGVRRGAGPGPCLGCVRGPRCAVMSRPGVPVRAPRPP
jgi:hypothetical protein